MDCFLTIDQGLSTALIFLELCAAFDTTELFLWFNSYLSNHYQFIQIGSLIICHTLCYCCRKEKPANIGGRRHHSVVSIARISRNFDGGRGSENWSHTVGNGWNNPAPWWGWWSTSLGRASRRGGDPASWTSPAQHCCRLSIRTQGQPSGPFTSVNELT